MGEEQTAAPPVSGRSGGGGGGALAGGTLRGEKQAHRRRGPNPARQEFLGGLLTEDVQTLVAWHADRPEHEQKRLLKTLGSLYTSHKEFAAQHQKRKNTEGELLATDQADGEQQAAEALRKSESAPELVKALKPIDVFEQKRRAGVNERRRRGSLPENTLQRWLEQESNASTYAATETTVASSWTGVSSMTKTSLGGSSANSCPCTTTKLAYKRHARGLAVNRRKWKTRKAHEPGVLEDGLPTDNFPDDRRLITTNAMQFGTRPLGVGINNKMWESVFADDKHDFVEQHLNEAEPAERESFAGMVRALQNLRRIRHFSTAYERQFDAKENCRLWKPPKEKPTVEAVNLTRSQIPLGTISSIVEFSQERAGLPKIKSMPGLTPKADILVVGDDAASSIGDDALSLQSDPLRDLGAQTPGSISGSRGAQAGAGAGAAGYGGGDPVGRPVVPPVSLPPLPEE